MVEYGFGFGLSEKAERRGVGVREGGGEGNVESVCLVFDARAVPPL